MTCKKLLRILRYYAEAMGAMAAVRRGDQEFTDPCKGVGYTRSTHAIRDTESACEVCGVSHWLRQHGVHGHKSPWKRFDWHVKPQYKVELHPLDVEHNSKTDQGDDNSNNTTVTDTDIVTARLGHPIATSAPRQYLAVRSHVGALPVTPSEAAAADREMMFPVCEPEPASCTDACQHLVEAFMQRCMTWLHVSDDTRHPDGSTKERRAQKKAALCASAIVTARTGCAAEEHADCVDPVAINFESLLAF